MSDDLKRQAALAALEEIRDGMIVGLGSGSTASIFIRELGKRGSTFLAFRRRKNRRESPGKLGCLSPRSAIIRISM